MRGATRRVILTLLLVAMAAPSCGDDEATVWIAIGGTPQQGYPFVFLAGGPAVDEGLVCPSGDVVDGDLVGDIAPQTFVCRDGSGSFTVETVIDMTGFVGEGLPVSDWAVVSGTGTYVGLRGTGVHRFFGLGDVQPLSPISDVVQRLDGIVSR